MNTYISAEQYQSVLNYIGQTKLVKKLLTDEIIDNADLHTPDSEDDETLENDENENPYLDFDTWITFSEIKNYTDTAILDKKGVSYIDSEYGFWIGVCDNSEMDDFVKKVIESISDYELSDDELKQLKEGNDIKKVVLSV